MTINKLKEYYAETATQEPRADLVFATSLVGNNKIAIDCGCGAGSDIAYLRKEGFIVYAFDIEEESIKLCTERFKGDENITLSQDSFNSFDYPETELVVADASLFFCPAAEFDSVWDKIYTSLNVGGIFCGSFLGSKDSMADANYEEDVYWSNRLVFKEEALKSKLEGFKVLKFTEYNISGVTPQGLPHQWHIFSVVAKKMDQSQSGLKRR